MTLKAVLTEAEFEALPSDPRREEYVEQEVEGKTVYVLDVSDIHTHPGARAVKSALDREKTLKKDALTKVAALEARVGMLPDDFDPETYTRLVSEEQERLKDPHKRPDQAALDSQKMMFEQRLQTAERKRQEEVAALNAIIAQRDAIIEQREINDRLGQAVDAEGVAPHFREAAIAVLRPKVKTQRDEETGEVSSFIETDLGPEEVPKFVSNWARSDAGKHFVIKPTGGGAQGGGKHQKESEPNPWKKETRNFTEQGRIMREDRARAERLAKAAGVPLVPGSAAAL